MVHTPKNNTFIIWILGLLATITPFSIDLYLPSFAEIAKEFGTSTSKISLSVSSYFIGMAIGQMLYGPLLDRFGRKNPLYAGLCIFIFASIGCMVSSNVEMLIICRFFQAIGGSVAWVASMTMVKDFFPSDQSAKIFSLLILIIGVSPLLAPTIGGFLTTWLGWQSIFASLSILVLLSIMIIFLYLPEGHKPDKDVSLKAKPMAKTFYAILRQPQFYTYTFSGAFSFATLFIYVAGSPIIFMEMFQVSPQTYGGIFALLSVGFIGGSQLNIFLNKKYSSDGIFRVALIIQVITSFLFLLGVWNNWLDLNSTILMFFICLSCIGLINPNATALALAPIDKNVGSASALLGFTQIGVAALSSAGVGLLDSKNTIPIVALMAFTSSLALLLLVAGKRKITGEIINGEITSNATVH